MTIKLKYKSLLATAGIAILVLAIQIAFQFINAYRFVGFIKRDESTWVGIASKAQAEKLNCLDELDYANSKLKEFRDSQNEANNE